VWWESVDRSDLQQLAQERLDDANALFQSGRYSGAYYLAGYAVECGLKACIARTIRQYEYPPSANYSRDLFTHKPGELIKLAGLTAPHTQLMAGSPPFRLNWEVVLKWSEQARYATWTGQQADELIQAIDQATDGVMQWIRQHW
jgi:hypothetical protein